MLFFSINTILKLPPRLFHKLYLAHQPQNIKQLLNYRGKYKKERIKKKNTVSQRIWVNMIDALSTTLSYLNIGTVRNRGGTFLFTQILSQVDQ